MTDHRVQFYINDQTLVDTVVDFLADGLSVGQRAIVIAKADHAGAIARGLDARGIDTMAARRSLDLQLFDAREMLDRFMTGELPDRDKFFASVGAIVERTLADCPAASLRAFGDMVDELWKQGRSAAAMRLEALWDDLMSRHRVALLCGYAMTNFRDHPEGFRKVSNHHTHVDLEPSGMLP